MGKYQIHDLTDEQFEDLVTLICRELLGIGVTSFAKGRDGGKDAKFVGRAQRFPSLSEPAEGKFIVQAKHSSAPTASCSDYEFETSIIGKEIPKIAKQVSEGRLTHYLLFTNRRKTGGAEDRITERIVRETAAEHAWLIALEDIERELKLNPHVVELTGLNKLRMPIQFTAEDLRDVIVSFYETRSKVKERFDSQHEYQDYPGLPKKNEINGVSDEYHRYICESSMKHFSEIKRFLENPRNRELAEQYHAVADELKGQLILHRGRFQGFDQALEATYNEIHQRSPDLQQASRRRLTKVLVHYMYVDCDIGIKE